MDDVYAEADARLAEYRALESGPARVAALADEAAAAQSEFLAAHRALYSAGDGSGDVLLALIGFVAGDPAIAFGGLQGAIHASGEREGLERTYAAAFQRNRGIQWALAAVAPSFAGPPCARHALAIDLDESWHGLTTPYDVLNLRNIFGRDLHDCVVSVTLTGASGDKARNVHFIPDWPSGTVKSARYGIGVSVGGQQLAQQTVYSVQSVAVSVWSPELRDEGLMYTYAGAERDADIRGLLEGRLRFDAKLVDAGIINLVPRVDLTLRGVAAIPEHTITLEFHHGADQLTRSWTGVYMPHGYLDSNANSEARERLVTWRDGQTRSFQPAPRLPWMPEWAKVTISFAATGYIWTQRLDFPRRPATTTGRD